MSRGRKRAKKKAPETKPTAPTGPKVGMSGPMIDKAPPDDRGALDAILVRLEKARGRPNIVYWTSAVAKISVAAEAPIFDQLVSLGKQKEIDLVLFTGGGDTVAPWRIVSLIREFCQEFSVLIPHKAQSAGTLLALGADSVVMTPYGSLGPIDPSRTHPLLPRRQDADEPEPISVQDLRHAMQFIMESMPADTDGNRYNSEAMAQIFTALFDKIHPLAIGAIEQSYALAKLIARKCLETHMDPEEDVDRISKIVDTLCDEFKSHQYLISRSEAKKIGVNVELAPLEVEAALMDLLKFYASRTLGPFGASLKVGGTVTTQIAWVDSLRQKFRAIQDHKVGPDNQLTSMGDKWIDYTA